MTNNDVLRRIRYIFDFNDKKMIDLFDGADCQVSREEISNWLKKEEEPAYQECSDTQLTVFLDGLIIDKRGKREGSAAPPQNQLTNNIIFRKLKIALALEDKRILEIMSLAGLHISKHELSALFRKPDHKHYRLCKDQMLRNFLKGLQLEYRGETAATDL